MTEPGNDELLARHNMGSDEHLARIADVGAVNRDARYEAFRLLLEEWRLRNTSPAEDEPGEDHPDPDETPPADQEHPEFDPTPPKED